MWLQAQKSDNTGGSKMTAIEKDCLVSHHTSPLLRQDVPM